ncbi:Hypothetical predicted protein [Paramuricea clavata]|uniref:Uncharacterized protein n=2 Tax=Paramuricea clavata TaxID=317549 RepID=A0A7D9LKZ1_PARCT|nr:Hypothetical predicted protein [Paramuricea clavata]
MDEDASNEIDDSPSTSDEIKSCFASISCQTDEDPNKTVIDKLRKRIDDLEQDLKETKEKLNLQQQNKDISSCINKENDRFNNGNSKKKVKELIATFEETLQQNGTHHDGVIKENSERESSLEAKISELRSLWEEEKQNEMNKLKAEIQVKYDQEMVELNEMENVRRKQFAENLKRITTEQKQQEIEDAKQTLQRQHQQELDEIRNVFEQKRREFEESTNNLQRRHVASVNELRAVFEQRRRRELEETKSGLVRCHDMEVNELRGAMSREREKVISELKREHERVLRDTVRDAKRKQWCCNCQQEASYPCCWNTSYCSRHCQHVHWQQHRLHCSRNLVYVPGARAANNMAKL